MVTYVKAKKFELGYSACGTSDRCVPLLLRQPSMVKAGQDTVSEATRYRGYRDPEAIRYLDYFEYEYREALAPFQRGVPLN